MRNKFLLIIIFLGSVIIGYLAYDTFIGSKMATDENCFTFNVETKTITDYSIICDKDVVIPSKIDKTDVEVIGTYAFLNKGLTSVTLSSNIKEIGIGAFSSNKIEQIKFNKKVTVIRAYAFFNNALTKLSIPSSVTEIGFSAFNKNSIKGSDAFIYARNADGTVNKETIIGYGGSDKTVSIPAGVISIFVNAFSENELKAVTLSDTVERISANAFSDNKISNIIIPSSVKHMESDILSSNPLTKIVVNGKSNLSEFIYLGENWNSGCDNITFSK